MPRWRTKMEGERFSARVHYGDASLDETFTLAVKEEDPSVLIIFDKDTGQPFHLKAKRVRELMFDLRAALKCMDPA